jgi:hypothetical protein
MKKAKKGKLTRKEVEEAPFMRSLIRKNDFLNYCLTTEITEKVELTVKT